jgi:hypothetical protein
LSADSIASDLAAQRIAEGRRFSRYLAGREAPPDVLERYAAALERLPLEPRHAADAALLRFVRRNAWSLPPLDAAVAFARRDSVLRGRLLLMLALLEATVELADDFLPRAHARPFALARVALAVSVGAAKTLIGLILLPLASRSR